MTSRSRIRTTTSLLCFVLFAKSSSCCLGFHLALPLVRREGVVPHQSISSRTSMSSSPFANGGYIDSETLQRSEDQQELRMPNFDGKVVQWFRQVGDPVSAGDAILAVESSDKKADGNGVSSFRINTDVEAPIDGYLAARYKLEGDLVEARSPLATIVKDQSSLASFRPVSSSSSSTSSNSNRNSWWGTPYEPGRPDPFEAESPLAQTDRPNSRSSLKTAATTSAAVDNDDDGGKSIPISLRPSRPDPFQAAPPRINTLQTENPTASGPSFRSRPPAPYSFSSSSSSSSTTASSSQQQQQQQQQRNQFESTSRQQSIPPATRPPFVNSNNFQGGRTSFAANAPRQSTSFSPPQPQPPFYQPPPSTTSSSSSSTRLMGSSSMRPSILGGTGSMSLGKNEDTTPLPNRSNLDAPVPNFDNNNNNGNPYFFQTNEIPSAAQSQQSPPPPPQLDFVEFLEQRGMRDNEPQYYYNSNSNNYDDSFSYQGQPRIPYDSYSYQGPRIPSQQQRITSQQQDRRRPASSVIRPALITRNRNRTTPTKYDAAASTVGGSIIGAMVGMILVVVHPEWGLNVSNNMFAATKTTSAYWTTTPILYGILLGTVGYVGGLADNDVGYSIRHVFGLGNAIKVGLIQRGIVWTRQSVQSTANAALKFVSIGTSSSSSPFVRFHHVTLKTRNIDAAMEFYSLLGFEKRKTPPSYGGASIGQPPPTRSIWLEHVVLGAGRIALIEVPNLPQQGINSDVYGGQQQPALGRIQNQDLLGLDSLTLDVSEAIRQEGLANLSDFLVLLDNKSNERYGTGLRMAMEPRTQAMENDGDDLDDDGNYHLVYESAILYDPDGSLVELQHRTKERRDRQQDYPSGGSSYSDNYFDYWEAAGNSNTQGPMDASINDYRFKSSQHPRDKVLVVSDILANDMDREETICSMSHSKNGLIDEGEVAHFFWDEFDDALDEEGKQQRGGGASRKVCCGVIAFVLGLAARVPACGVPKRRRLFPWPIEHRTVGKHYSAVSWPEWLLYNDPRGLAIEDASTGLLERFSLVTLIYAPGGESLKLRQESDDWSPWLNSSSHCDWDPYIDCDKNGRITTE
eukprot:scaffold4271_cov96-Cylindrotheca_fusiformis.AAC.3